MSGAIAGFGLISSDSFNVCFIYRYGRLALCQGYLSQLRSCAVWEAAARPRAQECESMRG